MEQRIYKFQLDVTDEQMISMPKGAEILTVQIQDEKPCLWALVNPKAETEIRVIEIFGTGNPMYSHLETCRKYISTFQMQDGKLVFHAFENTGM